MISQAKIRKLKSIEVVAKRGKKMVKLNAYNARSEEFLEWVAKRMKAAYSPNRLELRLTLIKLIREVL